MIRVLGYVETVELSVPPGMDPVDAKEFLSDQV